jgi:hypothetical protein
MLEDDADLNNINASELLNCENSYEEIIRRKK